MKNRIQTSVFLMALMFLASCGKERILTPVASDITCTSCKESVENESVPAVGITGKAINNSELQIDVMNVRMNCEISQTGVYATHVDGDRYRIDVTTQPGPQDCFCLRDLTFGISPMTPAKNYIFELRIDGAVLCEFDFLFPQSFSITVPQEGS